MCLVVGVKVRLPGAGGGEVLTPDFTPGPSWTRKRPREQFSKKNFGTSDLEERRGAQETRPNEIGGRGPKTSRGGGGGEREHGGADVKHKQGKTRGSLGRVNKGGVGVKDECRQPTPVLCKKLGVKNFNRVHLGFFSTPASGGAKRGPELGRRAARHPGRPGFLGAQLRLPAPPSPSPQAPDGFCAARSERFVQG